MHASHDRQAEVSFPITEVGLCTESKQMPVQPSQVFTHLGLTIDTRQMTISLPMDKVQAIKAQATQEALLPMCRGIMRQLGLTNFASMALPLERLHSHPFQFWWKGTYRFAADFFQTTEVYASVRSPTLMVLICAIANIDTLAPSPGSCDNR